MQALKRITQLCPCIFRSDEAFKRKRTNKDREIFSEKLFRAENNQKQHMSEANVWGKCAKRMRNIVKR